MKRTFLKRKTPLRATKPMRKVSDKQKAANVLYRKALKEWRAQHDGRCEMILSCKFPLAGSPTSRNMPASQREDSVRCHRSAMAAPHHLRGRAGALLYDTRNFVGLCKQDHQWCHDNANRARELGWLEF